MKGGLLFGFVFLLVFCGLGCAFADITGDAITGRATMQPTNLTVHVVSAPTLVIHSPLNQTYSNGTNLLLNYSQSGADNIWYNFDSGANASIGGSIYFNISGGSHTLFMYANRSGNITVRSVTFSVNITIFVPGVVYPGGGENAGPPNYNFTIECEKLVNVTGNETICCIDKNNNSVCDSDEIQIETPLAKPSENIFLKILSIITLLVLIAALIWFIVKRFLGGIKFLTGLKKKKVYSLSGNYLGNVEEVYVKENRIDSIAIELTNAAAKTLGARKILMKWRHVHSAKDVVIINKDGSDHIESIEKKE